MDTRALRKEKITKEFKALIHSLVEARMAENQRTHMDGRGLILAMERTSEGLMWFLAASEDWDK
jgi:hypothetical protein